MQIAKDLRKICVLQMHFAKSSEAATAKSLRSETDEIITFIFNGL